MHGHFVCNNFKAIFHCLVFPVGRHKYGIECIYETCDLSFDIHERWIAAGESGLSAPNQAMMKWLACLALAWWSGSLYPNLVCIHLVARINYICNQICQVRVGVGFHLTFPPTALVSFEALSETVSSTTDVTVGTFSWGSCPQLNVSRTANVASLHLKI